MIPAILFSFVQSVTIMRTAAGRDQLAQRRSLWPVFWGVSKGVHWLLINYLVFYHYLCFGFGLGKGRDRRLVFNPGESTQNIRVNLVGEWTSLQEVDLVTFLCPFHLRPRRIYCILDIISSSS